MLSPGSISGRPRSGIEDAMKPNVRRKSSHGKLAATLAKGQLLDHHAR
jgi:hypothetical protein